MFVWHTTPRARQTRPARQTVPGRDTRSCTARRYTCGPALTIQLALDKTLLLTSKATKKWLREHPREFTSCEDPADKIDNFVEVYTRAAEPFRWTYDGRPLKAA